MGAINRRGNKVSGGITRGGASVYRGITRDGRVVIFGDEPTPPEPTDYVYFVPHETDAPSGIKSWTADQWWAQYAALEGNHDGYSVTRHMTGRFDTTGTHEDRYWIFEKLPAREGKKTVFLQSGTHSSEKSALYSMLRIAQILVNDGATHENPFVRRLHDEVRVIIHPVENPNMSLAYANGKKANRQTEGWWGYVSPDTDYYPMSVAEVRNTRDILLELDPGKIHYACDFHDAGHVSSFGDYWVNHNVYNPIMRPRMKEMIAHFLSEDIGRTVSPDEIGVYPPTSEFNTCHCQDTRTSGAYPQFFGRLLGIPSNTVESCYDDATFDADFMNRVLKVYLNTVLINTFSDFKRPLWTADSGDLFKAVWIGAEEERFFSTRASITSMVSSVGLRYAYNTRPNINYGYKMLSKSITDDYLSPIETDEWERVSGNKSPLTPREYDHLLTPSALTYMDTYGVEEHCYYTLFPESGEYDKTVVIYLDDAEYFCRGKYRAIQGASYRFLRVLRDAVGYERIQAIREHCRLVIIPTNDISPNSQSEYPEVQGSKRDGTGYTRLCNSLSAIKADGEIDCFVYFWDNCGGTGGYRATDADADGKYPEYWAFANQQSPLALKLSALAERMNDVETDNVRYHPSGTFYTGSTTTVKTNSLLHALISGGYVKDGVRIMLGMDISDYNRTAHNFPISTGGTESWDDEITKADYEQLEHEIARRVSELVNIVSEVCGE